MGLLASVAGYGRASFKSPTMGEAIQLFRNGSLVASASYTSSLSMFFVLKDSLTFRRFVAKPFSASETVTVTVSLPTVVDALIDVRLVRVTQTIPPETVSPYTPAIAVTDSPTLTKSAAIAPSVSETVTVTTPAISMADSPTFTKRPAILITLTESLSPSASVTVTDTVTSFVKS
jgi:hypothetical protein